MIEGKALKRSDFIKKLKIDERIFRDLVSEGIIDDKENYSEKEAEETKKFRKDYPLVSADIKKKYKISNELFDKFISSDLIRKSSFFNEKDLEVLQSYIKLKRLGYHDDDCIRVLSDIGLPREENLYEDEKYIQLKELAVICGVPERTIKFYEKENIILNPRIYRNKRFYEKTAVAELELLRDLQSIGYKLNDIAVFLQKIRVNSDIVKSEIKNTFISELESKKNIIKEILKRVAEL